jgi:hypothetical protein
MVQVFCDKKGSGKTKALIDMANKRVQASKGDVVYIHDDKRPMLELNRKIRFVATEEYDLKDYSSLYGFLCGMLSGDYDIETVFIDGLSNIIHGKIDDTAHLFFDIETLAKKYGVHFYININHEEEIVPEFIRKYVS